MRPGGGMEAFQTEGPSGKEQTPVSTAWRALGVPTGPRKWSFAEDIRVLEFQVQKGSRHKPARPHFASLPSQLNLDIFD